MTARSLAPFLIGFCLLAWSCAEKPETAGDLASRLLAPCCYKQTLDVHASPLAADVRADIQTRMRAGASAADVESVLVAIYGERIRAVPHRNFLNPLGTAGMVVVGIALLAVFGIAWRSRARYAPELEAPVTSSTRDQMAAELAALDD